MNTVARGTRRNIGRFRLLQLKPIAPDDLWILGTGPENDAAEVKASRRVERRSHCRHHRPR